MGLYQHNAVVVTGDDRTHMERARMLALSIFPEGHVSEFVRSRLNGYSSFMISPDGSKEGAKESDEGDARRTRWIEAMDESWTSRTPQGNGSILERIEDRVNAAWVDVWYGDREPSIEDSSYARLPDIED